MPITITQDMTLAEVADLLCPGIDVSRRPAAKVVRVRDVIQSDGFWIDPTLQFNVPMPSDPLPVGAASALCSEIMRTQNVAIGVGAAWDVSSGCRVFCLGVDTQTPAPDTSDFVNLGNVLCFWRTTGEIAPCPARDTGFRMNREATA